MKDFLATVKGAIPHSVLKTSRNGFRHIRATNVTDEQALEFENLFQDRQALKNTNYSGGYLTHFINGYPVVLPNGKYKINSKDNILQKQFTPLKLGISGYYTDITFYVNTVLTNLDKIAISEELRVLLKALLFHVSEDIDLSPEEISLYKQLRRSIDKDYGEILSGLYLLKERGNVFFQDTEAAANFDISYDDVKYNVKSGNGSGQSFKSLDIPESDDPIIKIMKILSDPKIKGRDKIYQICDIYPSSIFEKFSYYFFNSGKISRDTLTDFTKDEYLVNLNKIFVECDIKKIGIPVLDGNFIAEDALLFSMVTILADNFDNDRLTQILTEEVRPDVLIMHIKFDGKKIYFHTPENPKYKFHYWGNYKGVTNNLPGYKVV